jgi:hypothetical protein
MQRCLKVTYFGILVGTSLVQSLPNWAFRRNRRGNACRNILALLRRAVAVADKVWVSVLLISLGEDTVAELAYRAQPLRANNADDGMCDRS